MSIQGRRHLVCLVWIAVGLWLAWRGLPYAGLVENADVLADLDGHQLTGAESWLALGLALVVGLGKGFTALRKGARRAVTHIVSRGESAPPWTVFSPVMILLVAIMIAAGITLRKADYDPTWKAWIVAVLYPGIGLALVIGGLLARTVAPLETATPAGGSPAPDGSPVDGSARPATATSPDGSRG